MNKEYEITDVKRNIITINGRQIHDSFIEKVYHVGDFVNYLNSTKIYKITKLDKDYCSLEVCSRGYFNGVPLTDIKLVNMENTFKIGDKVQIKSSTSTKIYKIDSIDKKLCRITDERGTYINYSCSYLKLAENVEKERVIKAANTSKEAYDLLKELYPDYFEDEKYFDLTKERLTDWVGKLIVGNFAYKSFYLSDKCNWEISQDEQGRSILIPTKK